MRNLESKTFGLNTVDAITDSVKELVGTVVDFGKESLGKGLERVIGWAANSVKNVVGGVLNDLFSLPIFPTGLRR